MPKHHIRVVLAVAKMEMVQVMQISNLCVYKDLALLSLMYLVQFWYFNRIEKSISSSDTLTLARYAMGPLLPVG